MNSCDQTAFIKIVNFIIQASTVNEVLIESVDSISMDDPDVTYNT